jgi:hypothetical protein
VGSIQHARKAGADEKNDGESDLGRQQNPAKTGARGAAADRSRRVLQRRQQSGSGSGNGWRQPAQAAKLAKLSLAFCDRG